jgi:lysophospholipase L1-like esterase
LLARIGLALASSALALELGARLLFEVPVYPVGQFTPRVTELHADPALRFRLKPLAHDVRSYPTVGSRAGFDVPYRINSQGLRDVERPVEKPAGTQRIAVLGDSIAFGFGVEREQAFPALLERRLAERFPGRPIEVLNFGVPGYDTAQEAALLEQVAAPFAPDLVLITYFVNDVEPEFDETTEPVAVRWARRLGLSGVDRGAENRGLERATWFLRRHSRAAELVLGQAFLALRRHGIESVLRANYVPRSAGWEKVRTSLARARDWCQTRGIELHLACFPYLPGLGERYAWEQEEGRVLELARELGLQVHDASEQYPPVTASSLYVHPADVHPNAQAHAWFADWLAHELTSAIGRTWVRPR